jgi:transcriptional regulator with XRE-family HTH domain
MNAFRGLHAMDKALGSSEHHRLTELLRSTRERAGLRQVDVAEALGVPQSFISKFETGERRLDLVELAQVCEALGTTLIAFVAEFVGEKRE